MSGIVVATETTWPRRALAQKLLPAAAAAAVPSLPQLQDRHQHLRTANVLVSASALRAFLTVLGVQALQHSSTMTGRRHVLMQSTTAIHLPSNNKRLSFPRPTQYCAATIQNARHSAVSFATGAAERTEIERRGQEMRKEPFADGRSLGGETAPSRSAAQRSKKKNGVTRQSHSQEDQRRAPPQNAPP